jgi:hypothetical protein
VSGDVRKTPYRGAVNETQQFIASLVHSLAWPGVVFGLVIVFRAQLSKLLDSPLRRFRAGPVELEWDRVLAKVEIEVPSEVPVVEGATGVAAELAGLAREAPATAIIEAFSRVEQRLLELIHADGREPAAVGAVGLARVAVDRGLISSEAVKSIEGIAVLRNMAAHTRTGISLGQAVDYLNLVDAVLYTLNQSPGHLGD